MQIPLQHIKGDLNRLVPHLWCSVPLDQATAMVAVQDRRACAGGIRPPGPRLEIRWEGLSSRRRNMCMDLAPVYPHVRKKPYQVLGIAEKAEYSWKYCWEGMNICALALRSSE